MGDWLNKDKAIGYALIVIGLIFGLEGTVFTFMGTGFIGQINQLIAASSAYGLPLDESVLRLFQSVLGTVVVYSLFKVAAGIACILLGYKALRAKE